MKAIVIDNNELRWGDVPEVTAATDEVVINVHASAVNRADLSQREGNYAPPPGASEILGLECAGVVEEVGEDVSTFSTGDRVCALLAGGGYAQRVNVPVGQVVPIPEGLDFAQAAALPEVFATAYLNIFMEANAKPGESVLVHAGASGVGTAAIQMCRVFGNPCYVTVGSDEKVRRCVELGAADGCDRHTQHFAELVAEWTSGKGIDVILDPVGGQYLTDNLRVLNTDGRLVIIGLLGGSNSQLSLAQLMMKRQRIIGSTLRARSLEAKTRVMDELRSRVWPEIEAGTVNAIVDTVLPIERADEAHNLIASNETVGKVILQVQS